MERIKYLDFDILIERVGERYRARVLQSPAGQASAEFTLPFSDIEVENLMLRVGRNRRGVRRMESPELQAAKQFGGRLFDAVFAGEVRGALRSSVDTADREDAGLRVRLRLADAPELVDLPWEFLYNVSLNRFLTLSNKTPLVRYIELPETPRPLKIAPPLRVLVMISSPGDYETLDVELEWQKLNDAVRELSANNLVQLERLEAPTLSALRKKLRQGQYHVLHFIGHGGFDAQSQDGVLILADEQGRGRRTGGQYLATVLTDHKSMRLVVLNACEGGRTSRTDPFAGVAQSLVQQGIPAVIAMQFEITDEASITFAHEFYSALADSYPVDAALSGARSAIFTDVNDLEWGTPVLYLRAPDGMIFAPLSEQERAELERKRLAEEKQAQEQAEAKRRAQEREQQLEILLLAAQMGFAQNDFDAAEKSIAAVFALDPANSTAQQLRTQIQSARTAQAAEQERLAQEQRAREQAERERRRQIETLYLAAQNNFDKHDFDAAEKAVAALLELDATNAQALGLQAKIPGARERENQIELLVRGAEIQLAQARLDAADKSIDQILELDPKNAQALQLRTQLASAQEQIANQARTQQVEQHYADAQAAFAKQDFDAAEKALVALLALDAANAPALELQDKIQNARQQAVRVQQERDRKQQIENLFGQAQSAFTQKDYDAADKALAALFALDASNASARNLQKQIQDARKRAEPTPLTSSERIFAPPGIPERAETNLKSPTPAIVSDRSQGFPTRYALPIAGVIILALLLLGGGAYALGVFNRPTTTPAGAALNQATATAIQPTTPGRQSTLAPGQPTRQEVQPIVAPTTQAPTFFPVPSGPKVLRLGTVNYPDVLDPQRSSWSYEIGVLKLAYEGLLRLDENGNAVPGAADRWEFSPDRSEMTLHIRDGLERADGTPIRAVGFEYALKREVDPCVSGKQYSSIMYDVKGAQALVEYGDEIGNDCSKADKNKLDALWKEYGVRIIGDKALQITFKQPTGFWPHIGTTWVTFPTDARSVDGDPETWWTKPENHVGNGPFKITEIDAGNKIILAANPNYWQGKPKLDRIELYYFPDEAALLSAYLAGEVDLISSSGLASQLGIINGDPVLNSEFVRYPSASIAMFSFNHLRKPFDDLNVRTAFAQAFDREGYIREVLKGAGQPYTRWIPPGVPGANSAAQGVPAYDPKRAVLTLTSNGYAAAGSTAGSPKIDCKKLGEIKLTFPQTTLNQERFGFLAKNWTSVFGCPITLDPVEPTEFSALVRDPNTAPQIFRQGWIHDYPHPQNWLSITWRCNGYISYRIGYCSSVVDDILRSADANSLDASLELYRQAEDLILADVPGAITNYNENFALVKSYVSGPGEIPSSSDTIWIGSDGPIWEYDIDLTQVPSTYPRK